MQELNKISQMVVEEYGLDEWFKTNPMARPYAKDIINYLQHNSGCRDSILELGCGIAQNLAILSERGFTNLFGVERDADTFKGALDLCRELQAKVNVFHGDATKFEWWPITKLDVILPLNWTYQAEVNLHSLLQIWYNELVYGGFLIIDIITSDFSKDKSPEYVNRYNEEEFKKMVRGCFKILKTVEYYPRTVYYMEKI